MDLFTAIIIQLYCFTFICTFYIHDSPFQSTFIITSIIATLNELSRVLTDGIVIGSNIGDYESYYLSLICSIMIYLSIRSSEMIICTIFEWIKQYFDNLYDNSDANKPEHIEKWIVLKLIVF